MIYYNVVIACAVLFTPGFQAWNKSRKNNNNKREILLNGVSRH